METDPTPPTSGARWALVALLIVTSLGNVVAIGGTWCVLGCGAGLDPSCSSAGLLAGPGAALVAVCITVLGALVAGVAAVGIGLREWWGWWLAGAVFVCFLCSSCMPLALLGLVLLADPSVRAFAIPLPPDLDDEGEE